MKYLSVPIVIAAAIFYSCSSTTNVRVSMLVPGAITIRPDIKTMVLLDRAIAPETRKNKIESILTEETPQQDKQGRQQALAGLFNALKSSPTLRGKLTTMELSGDGTGTFFPMVLSWDTIDRICTENGADALIALETYDSDCIITHETGKITTSTQFGITLPNIQFYATQKIIIKIGFRIYDPKSRTVIDQYIYSYWRTWNSEATSLGEAMTGLFNRKQAINQTCYDAGANFEKHISPVWVYENRSMYMKSGNSPMAIGGRQAYIGNWAEATENWKQALASAPGQKIAGRASYNLALACEVAGDLLGAKEWISKSYGNYNNKKARYYQYAINRRCNEVLRLDQQMDNGQNK